MTVHERRHYDVPTGPVSRFLLLADLVLALALLLARDAALRLLVCAAAVPCSLVTCAVLRWRVCGDLKEVSGLGFCSGHSRNSGMGGDELKALLYGYTCYGRLTIMKTRKE